MPDQMYFEGQRNAQTGEFGLIAVEGEHRIEAWFNPARRQKSADGKTLTEVWLTFDGTKEIKPLLVDITTWPPPRPDSAAIKLFEKVSPAGKAFPSFLTAAANAPKGVSTDLLRFSEPMTDDDETATNVNDYVGCVADYAGLGTVVGAGIGLAGGNPAGGGIVGGLIGIGVGMGMCSGGGGGASIMNNIGVRIGRFLNQF